MVALRRDQMSERKVQFSDIFLILECNVQCDCGCIYTGSWKITSRGTIDWSARLGTNRWLAPLLLLQVCVIREKRRRYDVQSTSFFHFLRPTSHSSRVLSAVPTLYLIAISKGKRDLSPHER